MVLEVATLNIRSNQQPAFEQAFQQAAPIIARMRGYVSHQLLPCIEDPHRYLLLVHWQTLEDHTIGFRTSPGYQQWKQLLHHFYDPFPTVDHYTLKPVP
jgi:heme-degrading monooxygenase HmoA